MFNKVLTYSTIISKLIIMKKLLFLLLISFSTLGFSQYTETKSYTELENPYKPTPNFTLYGGGYAFVNFVEYAEFGVMGGVNMKDIFMVGPYYQYSIKGNHFYGLYTQVNITPKHYFATLGLALRTGYLHDSGKMSVEGGLTFQHNTLSDRIKFIHQLGFTAWMPHYGFGVLFGNFGPKQWRNPNWETSHHRRVLKKDL